VYTSASAGNMHLALLLAEPRDTKPHFYWATGCSNPCCNWLLPFWV